MKGKIREKRSSNGSEESVDMISALPNEIREYILGYLPVCDAIRTCVLSRKWRSSWKRAPRLNICFDEEMKNKIINNETFSVRVGRLLLFHVGPIHTFVLTVSRYYHEQEEDWDEDMNAWLQFLSRNGMKDFRLICHEELDGIDIPESVFQCPGLSCLTLNKINFFHPQLIGGFPNLVRLVLYDVYTYEDLLENVISSSPIEELILEKSSFWSGWPESRPRKTAISSPTLRVLRVVCSYAGMGLSYSYLKYTPNLRSASFTIGAAEVDRLESNCFDVLQSMPKIEVLTFECLLHKTSSSDVIHKNLPELLVNLNTVTLYGMDATSVDTMSFMFCIIRSAPNLQTLDIHPNKDSKILCKDALKAATAYLDDVNNESIKASVTTLSVTIRHYSNEEHIKAETALIWSVVSCYPILEKLFIRISPFIKGPAKPRLLRAFRRLGRSSSKLKIIYSDAKY